MRVFEYWEGYFGLLIFGIVYFAGS